MQDKSHLISILAISFSALINHWIGFANVVSLLNAFEDLSSQINP